MPGADDFMFEDNWLGSSYELAMQIGPRDRGDENADERLRFALRAVWSDPVVEGCYVDRWTAPSEQRPVPAADLALEPGWLYGWANLPQARIVCSTYIVREDGDEGNDWLDLCLPTGALERAEPRLTYPIGGEASRSWREPLDAWFAGIAERVAEVATFQLAIIGEEVSGRAEIASGTERGVSIVTVSSRGIDWKPPERW